MSRFLSVDDVRRVCYEYAKSELAHDEPIPAFDSRFPNTLEQILGGVQQPFHKTLARQAAVLFYEMIKQHPFLNGNKRIATVSLVTFLRLNGKWIATDWRDLYNVAVKVAESATSERDNELDVLEHVFRTNMIDWVNNEAA